MALSVQQSQEYLGNDRWRWSIWLSDTPEELDSIDDAIYILHPTFHNPVRCINDRATNFRLNTSGWGTFTVHFRVVYRDGHETSTKHDLVLLYPDDTTTLV